MQKKLLATVVASLVAGQAMALEVYNDDTTSPEHRRSYRRFG